MTLEFASTRKAGVAQRESEDKMQRCHVVIQFLSPLPNKNGNRANRPASIDLSSKEAKNFKTEFSSLTMKHFTPSTFFHVTLLKKCIIFTTQTKISNKMTKMCAKRATSNMSEGRTQTEPDLRRETTWPQMRRTALKSPAFPVDASYSYHLFPLFIIFTHYQTKTIQLNRANEYCLMVSYFSFCTWLITDN